MAVLPGDPGNYPRITQTIDGGWEWPPGAASGRITVADRLPTVDDRIFLHRQIQSGAVLTIPETAPGQIPFEHPW